MRGLAASVLVVALLAGQAQADEPAATGELRVGAQVESGRPGPAIGGYLAARFAPGWSAGAGYELLRWYHDTLQTSSDTGAGPIIVGGVRAGVWRQLGPGARGWFLRAGLIAGFAAPALSPRPSPRANTSGLVWEAGADLTAGRSFRRVRVAAVVAPVASFGELRTRGEGWAGETSIAQASVQVGIAVTALF